VRKPAERRFTSGSGRTLQTAGMRLQGKMVRLRAQANGEDGRLYLGLGQPHRAAAVVAVAVSAQAMLRAGIRVIARVGIMRRRSMSGRRLWRAGCGVHRRRDDKDGDDQDHRRQKSMQSRTLEGHNADLGRSSMLGNLL